jgi:two-component system, sensor histidine kinase YesM
VDNYIYILNVRLTGDILFRKEVSGDIGNVWVPSMILQPIVENAVKHGISDIDRPGEILLKVEQHEDHFLIVVKDNGVGMTKEKIKEVFVK